MWMDKIKKKLEKEKAISNSAYENLKYLFLKYNVDFEKNFKITKWENEDKILFEKSMVLYGYENLIKKYK